MQKNDKNFWLKQEKLNQKEKEEILSLSEEEFESIFNLDGLKFGTAGVRAIMAIGTTRFNRFTYTQLTEAYCKWLLKKNPNPKIIIARDNRKNGSEFQDVCSKVASSLGVEVFLISENRIMATPIISFLIKEMKLDGAIIITASHNPKNYNGFKIYKENGGQLIASETDEVQSLTSPLHDILLNNYFQKDKLIKNVPMEAEKKYFELAKKALINTNINDKKNFPIVFSPHHGTSVNLMEKWLKSLGYVNVISVNEQNFNDFDFINSPLPNPEDKKSFELSIKYAEKNNAEIMLATDPDSDRLAIVIKHENEWHYLSGNEAGLIYAEYVLTNKKFLKKPMIISTHVSTSLLEVICDKNNVDFFKTGTGFKWLAHKMNSEINNHDLVVAFEEAIGSLNSDINSDKDSFQAAALILEIFNFCLKEGMTLIDYLNKIFEKYAFWSGDTVYFQMDAEKVLNWKEIMNEKIKFFKSHKPNKIAEEFFLESFWNEEGDCLEWHFSNKNSIKFRISGTEPKFKAYINSFGTTKEKSKHFLKESIKYIDGLYNKN